MHKLDIIRSYYESNLDKELPDYQILGWENRAAQFARFKILTDNVNVENKSVLDVGCGFGSLLEHFKNLNFKVKYTGVDILECMIKHAAKEHPQAEFYCLDLFEKDIFGDRRFDLLYASGIFNLNLGNNYKFLKHALKKFLILSKKFIVFNLLHHHSPEKEKRYFYYHPEKVVKIIERLNCNVKKIQLIEHYLKNDFTVILEK